MFEFFEVVDAQETAINHALSVLQGVDDKAIDEFCGMSQQSESFSFLDLIKGI